MKKKDSVIISIAKNNENELALMRSALLYEVNLILDSGYKIPVRKKQTIGQKSLGD